MEYYFIIEEECILNYVKFIDNVYMINSDTQEEMF